MSKLALLNVCLNKLGFELTHYNTSSSSLLRRRAMFDKYGVDLIIDVGANTGIYGLDVRRSGYRGRIVSFEPLNDIFRKLKENTAKDAAWEANNYALGSEDGKQFINVSANSHSSSVLEILDA